MGLPEEPSSPLQRRGDFFIGELWLSDQKALLQTCCYPRTLGAPGQIAAPLGVVMGELGATTAISWVALSAGLPVEKIEAPAAPTAKG
jgi:hypothetical protein